jgi:hypothetical protein
LVGVLVLGLGYIGAPLAAQEPSQDLAPAHHSGISLAFRFLTLGFGLEAGKLLTDHLSARVGANYFKFSKSKTQSDISYDASLKLHAVSALLDLYPHGRGSFHFTGGLMTNPVTVTATGKPSSSGTFKINGNTYTTAQVGTLTATGKYPDVRPYLGLGFGTPARGGPLAFLFDLGAELGKPAVSLTATGGASNPQLAADLKAQADKTQHDVRKYAKVYPVVSLGLAYRF